jgi:hypothetical protein
MKQRRRMGPVIEGHAAESGEVKMEAAVEAGVVVGLGMGVGVEAENLEAWPLSWQPAA